MKRGSIYDVEKDSTNQYKSSNKSVIFETNW
jgi:hypothetical protein